MKSSNHTVCFHRLTSNSSSTTNFPWLFPTDSWLNSHSRILLYNFWTLNSNSLVSVALRCTPLHPNSLFFGTQLLQAIFRVSYKPSARTTQKTPLPYCCVFVAARCVYRAVTQQCMSYCWLALVWKCLPSNGISWFHSLMLWANPLHLQCIFMHVVSQPANDITLSVIWYRLIYFRVSPTCAPRL
jgi:hypothetical protein